MSLLNWQRSWRVLVCLLIFLFSVGFGAKTVHANEPTPTIIVYVVQKNDTLLSIARRFNTNAQAIASANNIRNPNLIWVGQRLVVPTATSPITHRETTEQTSPGRLYILDNTAGVQISIDDSTVQYLLDYWSAKGATADRTNQRFGMRVRTQSETPGVCNTPYAVGCIQSDSFVMGLTGDPYTDNLTVNHELHHKIWGSSEAAADQESVAITSAMFGYSYATYVNEVNARNAGHRSINRPDYVHFPVSATSYAELQRKFEGKQLISGRLVLIIPTPAPTQTPVTLPSRCSSGMQIIVADRLFMTLSDGVNPDPDNFYSFQRQISFQVLGFSRDGTFAKVVDAGVFSRWASCS